jgi:hypothetical protein
MTLLLLLWIHLTPKCCSDCGCNWLLSFRYCLLGHLACTCLDASSEGISKQNIFEGFWVLGDPKVALLVRLFGGVFGMCNIGLCWESVYLGLLIKKEQDLP